MKPITLTIFVILSLITTFTISQESVYNNFGAGHEGWDYNYGLGWTLAGDSIENQYGVEQAMGFEATASGFVTDIWVAISYVPMSTFSDTVIIRLAENPDGLPPDTSNIMEEWMLTHFDSWSQWNTPIHLTGDNTSELQAGHSYWLWALTKEDTWTMWCMNEDGAFTCPHTMRRENEDWLAISNETASAFRIDISTGVGFSDIFPLQKSSRLSQNFPNPFVSQTRIAYSVEKADHVRLTVYDLQGKEIRSLVNEFHEKGNYTRVFNAIDLPAGLYIYSLQTGQELPEIRKMQLLR